jgi:hypothetical protein
MHRVREASRSRASDSPCRASAWMHERPGQTENSLAAITQAGGWKSTRMPLQYAEKINAARSGHTFRRGNYRGRLTLLFTDVIIIMITYVIYRINIEDSDNDQRGRVRRHGSFVAKRIDALGGCRRQFDGSSAMA